MKILAIGAHPDDVEFGCAPLLIKEIKKGNQVKIVVCSLGEAGTNGTPEGRKQEAEAAAKLIGAEIEFLDLGGDSHITDSPENAFKIASIIRKYKPEIVLAPSQSYNQHPDHKIISDLTKNASRFARYGGLKELAENPVHKVNALYYYASSAEWDKRADVIIDVTDVYADWEAAMSCHKSQMKTKAYIDMVSNRAAYLGSSVGVKYAVGLWANDPLRVDNISDISLSSRNY